MRFYSISYEAGCLSCQSRAALVKVVMSDDEIKDPSREEMLDLIDHTQQATCPNCGSEGRFQVLSIEFDGIEHDYTVPPKMGIINLSGEKQGGIPQGDIRTSSSAFAHEDLKNALVVMGRQLEAEREKEGAFIEDQDGSFILGVKFQSEPPYIKPWGCNSYGFTYAEIKTILDSVKSQLA